jgi:hypothetical protein
MDLPICLIPILFAVNHFGIQGIQSYFYINVRILFWELLPCKRDKKSLVSFQIVQNKNAFVIITEDIIPWITRQVATMNFALENVF